MSSAHSTQDEESELEQVEAELNAKNDKNSGRELRELDKHEKSKTVSALQQFLSLIFSQIFLKAFTLTFLAEWGDRSQIATIG